jgi:pSer/pThr/pTyr-binding forkhead associated (FHA) protein
MGAMAILEVISGAFEGRRFALSGATVSIGREPENDVCLPFASLSRRHAILALRDGVYELRDLNSTNGTFVRGEQVTRVLLAEDAPLRFGEISVQFLANEVAPPAPVPRVVKIASAQSPVVSASIAQQPAPKVAEPSVAARPAVEFRIGSVLKKREGSGQSAPRADA